jgi:PAS domain S-box-containing protein
MASAPVASRRVARRAEHRLAERDLRRMLDRAPDVVFRYRLRPPGYEYVSRAIQRISGYTPDELYADPAAALRIVHRDDRQIVHDILARGTGRVPIVVRWQRKDGTVTWVEQRNVPVHSAAGQLIAVEGIAREIADPTTGPRPYVRVVDDIRIDLGRARALIGGRDARLTPSEFRLLVLLTDTPGRTVPREAIMEALWDSRNVGTTRACEVHVSKLRAKLESDSGPARIETVRAKGYRFIPAART